MDNKTEYKLANDYEFRINFVVKLKRGILIQLYLIKIVLAIILFYLVIEPGYFFLFSIINYLNKGFGYSFDFFVVQYRVIYILFTLILLLFIAKNQFPARRVIFLIGLTILIAYDNQYQLWILKFILLFLLIKLPEVLSKYSKSFDNYKSYKESFIELISLKNSFDSILKNYLINTVLLIILSYFILAIYELISIRIGYEFSVGLVLIVLPILIIGLFYSDQIFSSIKNFEEWKQRSR